MAYIYQIVNDINDKIYIGKTEFSIEQRFKQHCKDAFREKNEKRPLYSAMRKYGINHFHIELIEETNNPNEREIYWIKEKNTYHNGYNATRGGDGKKYIDYQQVIDLYKTLQNQQEVANQLNISVDSVRAILRQSNIQIIKNPTLRKAVFQLSKNNEIINSFNSCGDAARYLIEQGYTSAQIGTVTNKITECRKGTRKSAYGFLWKPKN